MTIGADLLRLVVLLTVPLIYAAHALTYAQLVAVEMLVAAADIIFTAPRAPT